MNTLPNLTILDNPIRVFDGLYSLNDLHKASGSEKRHEPNRFVRLDQTQDLIREIERCPDVGIALKSKRGGSSQGTWVCKELVYSYAMWISAKFSLVVIRAFDALVSPKQPDTLTKDQKGHIYQAVMRICSQSGLHYGKVFGELKRAFNVASYADIKQSDFALACEHLGVEPLEGEYIPNQRPTPTISPETQVYLCALNRVANQRLHELMAIEHDFYTLYDRLRTVSKDLYDPIHEPYAHLNFCTDPDKVNARAKIIKDDQERYRPR